MTVVTESSTRYEKLTIAGYVGGLGFVFGLTGLASIPIQYFLKDRLHLSAQAIANFGFVTGLPTYLAFLLGFLRDRWSPLGRGDRGYFILFAPIAATVYLWLAAGQNNYTRLLIGVLLSVILGQLLAGAYQALTASVAQHRLMPGRLSTLANAMNILPGVLTQCLGGWLTERLPEGKIFLLTATLFVIVFLFALMKPAAVFSGIGRRAHTTSNPWSEIVRLIRYKPLWPAAAIGLLGNFMPGFGTPLFFYLTDKIKLTPAEFGVFQALFSVSFLPTVALYGLLCRRFALSKLLVASMVVTLPQVVPLLFIHTPRQALVCAVLMGLMGGMAVAASTDVLIRSCPRELEGTGMMLGAACLAFASASSNVIGAWIFARGGFLWCVIVTTVSYALIFPLLLVVPRAFTIPKEGEALPVEA